MPPGLVFTTQHRAMVEAHSLILRPCHSCGSATGARGSDVRLAEIVEAETGKTQGYVYRRRPASWWRRWLGQTTLAVHEADDEPLLLTLHPSWPLAYRWVVCDADDRELGFVWPPLRLRPGHAGRLHAFHEDIFLTVERDNRQASVGRFLSREGVELALLDLAERELRLTFAAPVAAHPLLKMLLLAATVVVGRL